MVGSPIEIATVGVDSSSNRNEYQ